MIIFADGFEKYGLSTTYLGKMYATAQGTLYATIVRDRANSWGANSGVVALGQILRKILGGSPRSVVGVGLGYYLGSLPTSEGAQFVCSWRNPSNVTLCSVLITTTGAIEVRDAAGTVLVTSNPIIPAGAWNHIEMKPTFNGVAGSIEVRVNEVAVIGGASGVSGAALNLGAAASCAAIQTSKNAGNNGVSEFYVDDLVVWDDDNSDGASNNDFLGDCSVLDQMPTSDTAQADFTKSTGTVGFAIIDDTPPDADYIQGAVAGDRSNFGLSAFVEGNIFEVRGLVLFVLLNKASAGTGTFKQGIKTAGAVDALGSTISPASVPTYYTDVISINPDTSARFLVPAVATTLLVAKKVT